MYRAFVTLPLRKSRTHTQPLKTGGTPAQPDAVLRCERGQHITDDLAVRAEHHRARRLRRGERSHLLDGRLPRWV